MINAKETALLVIDMQNDFVEEGAVLEVPTTRNNLKEYKTFIDVCRKKGVAIIYTRHCYDAKKNPIEARLFPQLKKGGLREGTPSWDVCNALKPERDDIIVNKTRYDAFYNTNLGSILKRRKITNLIITGTMTEVCCESTARSGMFQDYNIFFCADMNYTLSEEAQENTLKGIAAHFGDVTTASKIEKQIK
ncbi:MAG: isochorismatase family cysteine hydrolase [Nanoarchaeota archaeon]